MRHASATVRFLVRQCGGLSDRPAVCTLRAMRSLTYIRSVVCSTPAYRLALALCALALTGCVDEEQRLNEVVRDEIVWCAQDLGGSEVKTNVEASVEAGWTEQDGASIVAKVKFSLDSMSANSKIRRFLYANGIDAKEAARILQDCAAPRVATFLREAGASKEQQERLTEADKAVKEYIENEL